LITGPSKGGIGGQTAVFLAAGKPKLNLLAWRSLPKVQPVIEEIKKSHPDVPVTFIKLDLASQASIREAAKQVNSKVDKLDVLINNAGGAFPFPPCPYRENELLMNFCSYGSQGLYDDCRRH
jgi:NAD(P)-dependent dehydrogenase (short-subunit alcohol dehydrogenase family)